MKHNSLCPGVYSLELFECQVYISNCINTLASNTAWNGSKLVEKKIPRATSNLKKKSLRSADKEEMITAGVWFKELVHTPCAPAESHVINPHPFVCMTPHTWAGISVDHGTIFIIQIFPDPWPPDTYTAMTFLWNSHPVISQFLTHLFACFLQIQFFSIHFCSERWLKIIFLDCYFTHLSRTIICFIVCQHKWFVVSFKELHSLYELLIQHLKVDSYF